MPTNDVQDFTERELQVIQLLVEGKNTIASQLGICTRSVEHHLTHIYEKVGVCSRTEVVIKLIQLFEK
jgi:DNA-binding NarL/FixJ family response regulator